MSKRTMVKTEDLGKTFEMAICLLYGTPYDGIFKYSIKEATLLKDKLFKLKEILPYEMKHISSNGNKYDFGDNVHTLSAKTTKKNSKVCPQVIGQPTKKKFCEFFAIEPSFSLDQIKQYIEYNISDLLGIYISNTFHCPIIYYNQHKHTILFIKMNEPIIWKNNEISFTHIKKNKKWNESSSIIVNGITIGEFQVHNHRDNIKFRWSFEKLLNTFKEHFNIIHL